MKYTVIYINPTGEWSNIKLGNLYNTDLNFLYLFCQECNERIAGKHYVVEAKDFDINELKKELAK